MKRSENSHERFAGYFAIFNPSNTAGYFHATKLCRTVFHLACVVEGTYTTARIAVPG
jgi:hypothetical protein